MTRTHKFEAMLPHEFRAEIEGAPVLYCPFGGVEYHGIHQSMSIDYTKGHAICLRTAALAGGVVHPPVPLVPAGRRPCKTLEELKEFDFACYPGVFVGRDLFQAMANELIEFFAECLKVKLCVLFGSHGPASAMLKELVEQYSGKFGNMHLMPIASGDYIEEELLQAKEKYGLKSSGAHGGLWETSMNMVLDPEGVRLEELDKPFDGFLEMPPDVVAENRLSSAEFGELLIDTYAHRLAKIVTEKLAEINDQRRKL